MTPQALVDLVERNPVFLDGPGDAFSGYAVIGLPFQSGHVLALRRFVASSLGPGYTSVWHRDPAGRWTFYSTVAPDQSCARYFGGIVDRNVVTPIGIEWTTPYTLRVAIGARLLWELTLSAPPPARLLNAIASAMPERWWQMSPVLRGMGLVANGAFGTGPMNLAGRTPNGHRFVAVPRRVWLIDSSAASVAGHDIGAPGPLDQQAALADIRIPQRGLFALVRARFERPARARVDAPRFGDPCAALR